MENERAPDRRTLRPSRWKLVGLSALSILLVAAGVLCLKDDWVVVGWFNIVFFGVCILVFAVMMLPGAGYLRLERDGFEICSLFRTSYASWSCVQSFQVARIGVNQMVVFNLVEGIEGLEKTRAVNRAVSGWEGGLPDTYGMSAQALADLMNNYREKAGQWER